MPPTQAKTFDESKWATLEAAVKAMQQKRPASTDFQVLNSHASDMCAHNMAPELYKRLQALLDTHLASVHAHLQALPVGRWMMLLFVFSREGVIWWWLVIGG